MKKVRCLLLLAVMFVIGATAAQAEKNFRPQGGIIAGKGECAISGVETVVSSASAKNTIVGASAGVYNVDTSSDNLSALTALYEEALADYKQCISYKSSATPDADYATAEGGLITSASQLYSNAKEPLEGSFEALIDEASDPTTFFHSDWHGGSYTGSSYHYIGVAFDKAVQNVQLKMSKRMRTSRSSYSPYFPRRVQVYACNDTTDINNAAWVLQGTLDVDWDYDIHEDFSTYSDAGKAGVALLSVPMDAAYKYVRLDVMPTYYRAVYFDLGALQAYEMQYDASASLIESVPADVRKAFEDQLASAKSAISAQKATADDVESLQKAYEDFIDNFMPKGNGKFYTIKLRAASPIVSGSCSLVWDASNSTISSRSSDSDLDKMGALWRFERVSASVSLVRLVTNAIGKPQYVDFVDVTDEGSAACLSDTGMVFRMSPCASGFRLKSVDYPGYYLSDYDGKLGSSTVEDDGGIFTVTLAAGQPSPVTFSATYEGVTIFSGEEAEGWYWKEGESVTAESDFFQTPDPSATHKGFSFSVSQDNAAFAAGQSVMLTASWSVPFVDGKFYTIKLRAENPSVTGSCSLVWNPSCSTISSRSSDSDLDKMGALWRFERVSASVSLVRLVTNAIGKPQYVDFVDVTDEGSAACLSDTGMVFRMSPCAGGFRLCSVDHTSTWAGSNHYLNDFDGRLGTSVNTDTGSTFTITLADEQPSPVTFTAMYDDATVFSGERAEGWYWKEGESVTAESDFFQTPDLSATHKGFSFSVSQDNAAFAASQSVMLTASRSVPFEEGKFYTMKVREGGTSSTDTIHSVVWNPSEGADIVHSQASDNDIDKMGAFWRFEFVSGTTDQVRVVSNAIGKPQYITIADMTADKSYACMTDTGTVFRVKPCNNGFRLCSPDNDLCNLNDLWGSIRDGSQGKLGIWINTDIDDYGSTFTITPAAVQPSPVTFSGTAGGIGTFDDMAAEGWYWKEGESVTAGSDFCQVPYDFYTVNADNPAFAEGTPVCLTASYPFPVSASYGPYNWTLLRTNDDDSHLCLRGGNGSAEVVTTGENSMDMSLLENVDKTARTGQWAFVCAGDEPNKFYLINRAGAFEHPVYRMGESGTLVPNSYLYDYGTAYSVGKQPAAVGSFTDGFTLACVTDGSPRLYDNGIYLSLGNEEVAEESRVFRTAEIDVPTAIATVEANTESYGGAGQGFVGEKVSSDEYLSALRATSTTSDFIEAYLTAAYRTPDPSKFYRITFTDGICPSGGSITADQYGTVNSDEQGMCRIAPVDTSDGAYSATSPAAISRIFPAVGYGKWVIQNVNSGVYWTDYVNDFSVGGDGTAYGIVGTENCDCNWALDCTTAVEDTVGAIVSLLGQHYDWSNPLSSFTDTNPATGCTGVRIQEVTECPLTFKAEYATLCLPFDVAVPYGVTSYKVTDATTTELVMEEIEGAIPAGTGVILKGTPGETVSFAITSDAQNMSLHPAANNRLTGVNVQREGLAPRSFYGLAKKKGHIAFYLSDVTEMPANKAYLLVTDTQGTLSDLLDFNAGTPTGVNGAEVQSEADSIYYDLSGRRVLYPAHGVYVKGNGQKVFVK